MSKHDETKLPKWAQKQLADLRYELDSLNGRYERMGQAEEVLHNRDWFTIPGPRKEAEIESYSLFRLYTNGAHPVCSIRKGDVLLVGRAKRYPYD